MNLLSMNHHFWSSLYGLKWENIPAGNVTRRTVAKQLPTSEASNRLAGISSRDIKELDTAGASPTGIINPERTVDDWVSAENEQVVTDLQENGGLMHAHLQNHVTEKPSKRTCPMPGMAKFIREVTGFINETVLKDTAVSEEETKLYSELVKNLSELKGRGYPWNESFYLMYKSAHFVSFYNRDKANHQKEHRSYYKDNATLESLNNLPWVDSLEAPAIFREALKYLWYSYHLEFKNKQGESLNRLESLNSFFFPCTDELDLPFFNLTWMLNIRPLGFIIDSEIKFDDFYGLCADFFEHDIFHAGVAPVKNSKEYLPVKVLANYICKMTLVDRDIIKCWLSNYKNKVCQELLALKLNEIDFPEEALHLLMFQLVHEVEEPLSTPDFIKYYGLTPAVLSSESDNKLRSDLLNLSNSYQQLTSYQIEKAACFMYALAVCGFWKSDSDEKAQGLIKQARAVYNGVLLGYADYFCNHGQLPPDVTFSFKGDHLTMKDKYRSHCEVIQVEQDKAVLIIRRKEEEAAVPDDNDGFI